MAQRIFTTGHSQMIEMSQALKIARPDYLDRPVISQNNCAMSSQMARIGLSGTLHKRAYAPRTSNCSRVACGAGRSDGANHPRLQGLGAAFLAGLAGLPRQALAGELMTFDSPAPSFTPPSLPDLPASVASSLPSLPVNQIQQVITFLIAVSNFMNMEREGVRIRRLRNPTG